MPENKIAATPVSTDSSTPVPIRRGFTSSEGSQLQTASLLVLASLACCAAAYLLKDVLLPFVFALFLAFTLRPLIDLITNKTHLPRVLSTTLTLLLAILLLVGLGAICSSSIVELSHNTDAYVKRVDEISNTIFKQPLFARLGVNRHDVLTTIAGKFVEKLGTAFTAVFNALFSLLSSGVLVAIYLMFILFGSSNNNQSSSEVWREIRHSIEYYVFVKVIISFVVGFLTWCILAALGVQMAVVFGLLTFALNFIPNVGPIAAVLLPLPVVVLSPGTDLLNIALVLALPTCLHMIVGHLVEPNVVGDSLELDPIVVLLALMLAGVLWGPVGMLLATPMAVVTRILLERVEWTKPLVDLMSGRRGKEPLKECLEENTYVEDGTTIAESEVLVIEEQAVKQ